MRRRRILRDVDDRVRYRTVVPAGIGDAREDGMYRGLHQNQSLPKPVVSLKHSGGSNGEWLEQTPVSPLS